MMLPELFLGDASNQVQGLLKAHKNFLDFPIFSDFLLYISQLAGPESEVFGRRGG